MIHIQKIKTGLLAALGLLLVSACGKQSCDLKEGVYVDSKTNASVMLFVTSKSEIGIADSDGESAVLERNSCTLTADSLSDKVSVKDVSDSSFKLVHNSKSLKMNRVSSLNGMSLDQIMSSDRSAIDELLKNLEDENFWEWFDNTNI